jgi:ATP-dependent DNA ligase
VPSGPLWAYEIKHDGYRFICRREGNRIRVFSRRGHDYTDYTSPRLPAAQHVKTDRVRTLSAITTCRKNGRA